MCWCETAARSESHVSKLFYRSLEDWLLCIFSAEVHWFFFFLYINVSPLRMLFVSHLATALEGCVRIGVVLNLSVILNHTLYRPRVSNRVFYCLPNIFCSPPSNVFLSALRPRWGDADEWTDTCVSSHGTGVKLHTNHSHICRVVGVLSHLAVRRGGDTSCTRGDILVNTRRISDEQTKHPTEKNDFLLNGCRLPQIETHLHLSATSLSV